METPTKLSRLKSWWDDLVAFGVLTILPYVMLINWIVRYDPKWAADDGLKIAATASFLVQAFLAAVIFLVWFYNYRH